MKPMKYTLWKKIERHTSGCVEDESETTQYEHEFILVSERDAELFGESIASDCGDQDYCYQVDYSEIANFNSIEELGEIKTLIESQLKMIMVKETQFQDYYTIEHFPEDFDTPREWLANDGELLNSIRFGKFYKGEAQPEGEYKFCGCLKGQKCTCEDDE